MSGRQALPIACVALCILALATAALTAAPPEPPRIDSVVMADTQPQQKDAATIWYDDFDGPAKPYAEGSGDVVDAEAFGGKGKSMLSFYEKGSRGRGGRKVFFGDSPAYRNKTVRKGERFDEVYWRVYVKHQRGWTGGGPAKMSRATSLVSENWAQAMIAHVWSSGQALTLDPASGVRDGRVVTTKYNDFPNLHWLGNKPTSTFKIHSTAESGRWVCVEARAKLNTPGKKDGENQLWIDGRLEAERKNLDWRGSYNKHGINAVFLETYWNDGSPVTQSRWFDNFVISTRPVGPVTVPANPMLLRTPWPSDEAASVWRVEVAADAEGKQVVWRSNDLEKAADRVTVAAASGRFTGALDGRTKLPPGRTFYLRAAAIGPDGAPAWSAWHQPLVTQP